MVRINIDVKPGNTQGTQPQNMKFLSSEAILRYLLGKDEMIETLILCKPEDVELITTDHNVYEALGSTKPDDNVNISRLTKLLEVVDIISYKEKANAPKPILKDERVEELRRSSLSKDKIQGEQP